MAVSDPSSAPDCNARELAGEARLADPGIPSEEHETRFAQLRGIHPGLESCAFGHPADEDRARNPANHRLIMVPRNHRFNG